MGVVLGVDADLGKREGHLLVEQGGEACCSRAGEELHKTGAGVLVVHAHGVCTRVGIEPHRGAPCVGRRGEERHGPPRWGLEGAPCALLLCGGTLSRFSAVAAV